MCECITQHMRLSIPGLSYRHIVSPFDDPAIKILLNSSVCIETVLILKLFLFESTLRRRFMDCEHSYLRRWTWSQSNGVKLKSSSPFISSLVTFKYYVASVSLQSESQLTLITINDKNGHKQTTTTLNPTIVMPPSNNKANNFKVTTTNA